jgi:Arc/MetJ family transcription regulator
MRTALFSCLGASNQLERIEDSGLHSIRVIEAKFRLNYTHTGVILYTLFEEEVKMRTNIVIEDELMQKAMRATGLTTKRAVVQAGLRMLLQVKAQTAIRRLRGKVRWEGNLKEMRAGRVQET